MTDALVPEKPTTAMLKAAGECFTGEDHGPWYPGQAPCPHCFESSGYAARTHSATWDEPAWEDSDPTRPCPYCDQTGTVDAPLASLDDLEELAAEERALGWVPGYRNCTMGVGCDEVGVCYAEAHNQPEQCPNHPQHDPDTGGKGDER